MLELLGVSVGFGMRKLVNQLSIHVRLGRCVAVLGANGVGKSTLLKTIIGAHHDCTGSIMLDGRSLARMDSRERARKVAFLSQEYDPAFGVTVADVALIGRLPHFHPLMGPTQLDRKCALLALELLGLTQLAERTLPSLSGGERRMALAAMVIAQRSNLVLLDEPTTHLDVRNALRLFQVLKQLRASEGVTVVFTAHDINHALAWADDVLLLSGDMRWEFGAVEEIITPASLEATFGVAFEVLRVKDRPVHAWVCTTD